MSNEPSSTRSDGPESNAERGGLWGLFFSTAGLFLQPFGVLLSIFGIAQGQRARRAARQNQATAPGATMSVIIGGLGVALSIVYISFNIVLWDERSAWDSCSSQAHTVKIQDQCDATLQQAVSERLGISEERAESFLPALGMSVGTP
ncbi:DUF4190 domain-containing protein [Salinactinospora qingdaonensis]|uniref:DUF4190 domain-containing protein n=1 Tax=Salinactinospora qingdaonensis TaxID=702744 RepID=A0ABP7GJN7_9ACTN